MTPDPIAEAAALLQERDKRPQSTDAEVADYLARGGRITRCPPAGETDDTLDRTTMRQTNALHFHKTQAARKRRDTRNHNPHAPQRRAGE